MNMEDVVGIAYGDGRLPLHLDASIAEWHVIIPTDEPALDDPHETFRSACRSPIEAHPLRSLVKSGERVVIVTSDGTRPVPNRVLLPWILEELGVPPENVTILIGTGTHRANTDSELHEMLGDDLCRNFRVINHDAFDEQRNVNVGVTAAGVPVLLDAEYVNADKRIAVGFIEPHFFAGFSGGPKAVVPGVAGIESIFHAHAYGLIAHAQSTFGVLDGNPLHETIASMVSMCPPDFLVNVTLNNAKAITGVFAGECRAAHRAGSEHVRRNAMVPVPRRFPIVVTSNSGYPLDQNLYQAVKGMSAASLIAERDGTIFIASECRDGIPEHGNFGSALRSHDSIESIDAWLRGLNKPVLDQWQVQVLVKILMRCRVSLYSSLDSECVRGCKLTPAANLEGELREHLKSLGKGAPVAVLPEGPVTIPYVA